MKKTFQDRVVAAGHVTAEALVSHGGLNTLASFQKALQFGDKKATCSDQNNPDLYGKQKVLYYNLLTSGKLHSHLADIEEQAQQLFLRLVKELAEKEGVTEQLKSVDPMAWVRKMNNIRSRAIEVISKELTHT